MQQVERLEQAIAEINSLPPKSSDKLAIFTSVRTALENALARGHSLKHIAEILAKNDLPISVSMLRQYRSEHPLSVKGSTTPVERPRASKKKTSVGPRETVARAEGQAPTSSPDDAAAPPKEQAVAAAPVQPQPSSGQIHREF